MRQFFLFIFLTCSLFGEIKEIHNIMEMKALVATPNKDDLILFDIDNAILEPEIKTFKKAVIKQNKERYKAELKKLTPEEIDLVHTLVMTEGESVLIDGELPLYINKLKKSALVLGFTGSDTSYLADTGDLTTWRFQELKRLGVEFSKFKKRIEFSKFASFRGTYPLYQDGVIYCNFIIPKGDVLEAFLTATELNPAKVTFVDDDLHNLQSVEKCLEKRKIPFLGLHYKVQVDKNTPTVSDVEWKSACDKIYARAKKQCWIENSSPELKEFSIKTNQGSLFCRKVGTGKPLLVIHGGPGVLTQDYLFDTLQPLAKDHCLIFYDQRGSGKSESVISNKTITVSQFVEDMEAIRKACGYKIISLFGHSWGGFLAMNYALQHEPSLKKMILIGSMPPSLQEYGLFALEWLKRVPQQEISDIEASQGFVEGDPEMTKKWLLTQFKTQMHDPKKAEELNLNLSVDEILNGKKVLALFAENTLMRPFDLYPGIQKLKTPTLIVHGKYDILPEECALHLHEAIKTSEYHVIEKCGHFPFIETPENFFPRVDAFLK